MHGPELLLMAAEPKIMSHTMDHLLLYDFVQLLVFVSIRDLGGEHGVNAFCGTELVAFG